MSSSTESSPVLLLNPCDTVAVCLRNVSAGERVDVSGQSVIVRQVIPAGHKMATARHSVGQTVVKFGCAIGQALTNILPGEHVHTHHLGGSTAAGNATLTDASLPPQGWSQNSEAAQNLTVGPSRSSEFSGSFPDSTDDFTFEGYVRPSGRIGTRNYLAVISNVNCSASVARMISNRFDSHALSDFPNVDGVISFRHESGCGMSLGGARHRTLHRVLAAMARHPNIGAYLMVGLGCEQGTIDDLMQSEGLHQIDLPHNLRSATPNEMQPKARSIPVLTIQDSGGTRRTVEEGVAVVREMLPEVNLATRSRVSAKHLVLGTECGGSDGYSGITANPVLGAAADLLVRCGGTVILSETPEIYGAEHLLIARARNKEVADKLIERLEWWKEYCGRYGEQMDNNPSVGNKAGGLTTIAEKSLGAVVKGGTSTLEAVYEYAQSVDSKGLVFMDTPGYDPASVTGLAAGGANLIAFTTGRGSCFGFKPVPSYKIASNTQLFNKLSDDMDFDAGGVIGGRGLSELGLELFKSLLETASGKMTCSERLGVGDEEFVPWLVGPVL